MKYTQEQFAKMIRTKFPEGVASDGRSYKDIDDTELVAKITEKYPVYKSQITDIQKITGTTGVKGVAKGIGKGVATTGVGLAELGSKIGRGIEKGVDVVFDKITGQQAPESMYKTKEQFSQTREKLKPKGTAEKIGFGAEQITEFFIPAGKVAQVEKVLASGATKGVTQKLIPILGEAGANKIGKLAELGTKVAVRGGEGAGVTAIQTGGDTQKIKQAGIAGGIFTGLVPVIGAIGSKPLGLVKDIAKRVAGGLTKGTKVIDSIIDNPRAALEGLKGESYDTLSKNASDIKNAVLGLQKKASINYELGLSSIDDAYKILKINPNDPKYFFEISTKLGSKADDILKEGNIEVMGGKLDFSGSPLVGQEENLVEKAYNVFSKHNDFSARGLETLAQKLQNFIKPSQDFASSNRLVRQMINSARDSVYEKAKLAGLDDVAEMTKKYAQAKDKIDIYEKLFDVNTGKLTSSTNKISTMKKLDDLFSGNKDIEIKALEDIGLDDVIGREAGRLLKEDVSRSVSSIGDLAKTVVSTVIPPKMIGRIVANLSLQKDSAQKVISALEKMKPAVRAAFIKSITGGE